MRSKPIARKLNPGSSGDEFESSARHISIPLFPQSSPSNCSSYEARNYPLTLKSENPAERSPPIADAGRLQPQFPMDQILSNKMHAERFLSEMARLQEPICDLDIRDNGVFAKVNLRRGTRYGPFAVKLCSEPTEQILAWEVIVGPHFRGWLEPLPEVSCWLRKIRSASMAAEQEANLKNFLITGYLWYETNRDIDIGEELLIDGRPKTPLNLNGDSSKEQTGLLYGDKSENERSNEAPLNGSTTAEDKAHTDKTLEVPDNEFTDDENGFDIRCEICDKTFSDLECLDDHLVVAHHFRKDEFCCDLCSRRFCHRPSLLKHRALIHHDIRKYPCENCTKVFCDPSNLQRHIRAHHIGARSHACPECGKTFATSSGLKQHTHIHSSVKPFQCEVCFKAYTQFSNLCRHKRMHADCRMQIKCNKCGQSFSTVTSLSKHKRFCDSTGPSSAAGFSSAGPHLPVHQQNTPPRVTALHSVTAAAAARTGASNAMATPPNPFLFFRSPHTFFPGFPAAYGLQGMFPQGTAQAANFPLMFPKSNMDMRISDIQHGKEKQHVNASDPIQQHFNFGLNGSFHCSLPSSGQSEEFKNDFNPLKSETKTLSIQSIFKESSNDRTAKSPTSKQLDSLRNFISDEDSKTSINIKSENGIDSKSQINDITDSELKTLDDDKKSIDVIGTPPPVEFNLNEISAEQPLDLSVSRNRQRRGSSSSSTVAEANSSLADGNENHKNPKIETDLKEHPLDQDTNRTVLANEQVLRSSLNSYQSSTTPSASPGPTPSPSPPSNSNLSELCENGSPSAMVCPRPIHPILLDEIYRSRALGAAFQRPFHFLGPMGGRPTFDPSLHHHHCSRPRPFPPEPAFQEALRAVGLSNSVLSGSTGKIKDRYTCKFCGKVFPRSANLTRHLRTHTGEQPYTCKYCDRAFSISSNLQRHVRNIHNKERPFRCHLCERCFGQQTNLDRHLKKHESDTAGLGNGLGDSPSSNEADREDSYFDEIRSFMGQVTYNEDLYTPISLGGIENDTDYVGGSDTENGCSLSRSPSTDATGTPKTAFNGKEVIDVSS